MGTEVSWKKPCFWGKTAQTGEGSVGAFSGPKLVHQQSCFTLLWHNMECKLMHSARIVVLVLKCVLQNKVSPWWKSSQYNSMNYSTHCLSASTNPNRAVCSWLQFPSCYIPGIQYEVLSLVKVIGVRVHVPGVREDSWEVPIDGQWLIICIDSLLREKSGKASCLLRWGWASTVLLLMHWQIPFIICCLCWNKAKR